MCAFVCVAVVWCFSGEECCVLRSPVLMGFACVIFWSGFAALLVPVLPLFCVDKPPKGTGPVIVGRPSL